MVRPNLTIKAIEKVNFYGARLERESELLRRCAPLNNKGNQAFL